MNEAIQHERAMQQISVCMYLGYERPQERPKTDESYEDRNGSQNSQQPHLLCIIEVRRNRHDRSFDLLAKVGLGRGLHLLKNEGRHFFGC